jgi:diguanylate cyclase (GGDEF)-like protein
LILSVAILSTALMRSDVEHREEAVIDPLTGMLNRNALTGRVSELTQQSQVTGQPIGLVIGDLDHFKGINDSLGHAVGDQVLKQIAYEMRRHLRAFDLAYRLGGDEFVFLLPGAEVRECRSLADQLRRAVEKTLGESVNVTISLGASASAPGQKFDYDAVFAAADGALYEAKQAGRNRVESEHVTTGEPVEAPELKAAFAD